MSELALPQLRGTRPEARLKIDELIKRGQKIHEAAKAALSGGPDFKEQLERVKVIREMWARDTIARLKSLFTDESIADEFGDSYYQRPSYGDPIQDRAAHFNQWTQEKITRLESIKQRIDSFPTMGSEAKVSVNPPTPSSRDIFLVHGHDVGAKEEVARFLEKLELHPIVLHEQPGQGRTIIEKFEAHATNVGFAVVLLTPDDIWHTHGKVEEAKSRARQNVILELGYFIGRLERHRVCPLLKGNIEFPSDFLGVTYTPMDDHGGWKLKLAKEIKSAGIEIDLNKAL